jgi:hypothetical protein
MFHVTANCIEIPSARSTCRAEKRQAKPSVLFFSRSEKRYAADLLDRGVQQPGRVPCSMMESPVKLHASDRRFSSSQFIDRVGAALEFRPVEPRLFAAVGLARERFSLPSTLRPNKVQPVRSSDRFPQKSQPDRPRRSRR